MTKFNSLFSRKNVKATLRFLVVLLLLVPMLANVGASKTKATSFDDSLSQPLTPENFRVEGKATSTNVLLTWDEVSNAERYILKRDGVVVYEDSDNFYFESEPLAGGKSYTYTLVASNVSGVSSEATLTVLVEEDPLPAPSDLNVTNISDDSVSIEFTEVKGATGYKLVVNGTEVDTITETSYTFTGLTPDTSYTFEISSLNKNGVSGYPVTLELKTTSSTTTEIEGFKVTKVTPTTVDLEWNDLETAVQYEVYRNGETLVYIGSETSYQDRVNSPESTVTYTVKGLDARGRSVESDELVVNTPKLVEPTPTEPVVSSETVEFKFKVIEGVSTYKISRNPTWTYQSNGDGTFAVSSVNSVTGEKKDYGNVKVTNGYLPFVEELTGSEGSNLTYEIVGYLGTGSNGELLTTDPIAVNVTIPDEGTTDPTDPDNGTEEPTTPTEPDNGTEEPTTPTEPDNGSEEPTTPTKPDNGSEEPTKPNPDNGTGQPTSPTDPSKPNTGDYLEEPTKPVDDDKPVTPTSPNDSGDNDQPKDDSKDIESDKDTNVDENTQTIVNEDSDGIKGELDSEKVSSVDTTTSSTDASAEGNELPKTATSIYNTLGLGVAVLLGGLTALIVIKRRRSSN